MTLSKILCATDFSAGAHAAMMVAARLARDANAELLLVHAWWIPASSVMEGADVAPAVLDLLITEGERGLQAAVQSVREAGVTRVSSKLVSGIASINHLMEADERIDLAVVGTHGRTGLARVLLGSVAERVVRHAPCSVLVVRPGTRVAPFDHVLCPIDFSDSSHHALELAAELARPEGKGITLLHTLELPVSFSGELADASFITELDRHGAAKLEEWAGWLRERTRAPVAVRSRLGTPGAQTLAVLDDDPSFDLVVTGSHGRTGLRRALLGSVAEKIVRHATPPVLVARQRKG